MKVFANITSYLTRRWKALLFRLLLANVVFLAVKLTMDQQGDVWEEFWSSTAAFYYFSANFLFLVCWEINDVYLRRQAIRGEMTTRSSFRIAGKTMAWITLFTLAIYYLGLFPLRDVLGIECRTVSYRAQFFTDVFRALLLGSTVTFFNMFYYSLRQREELKGQMEDLRKEMVASQYASLKSQISPHFLFNSLNTLTSLMYEDRDMASDFVSRLASSYRYILDNRESDLVSLEKELGFLENYTFMMEVRHADAVHIVTDMNLETREVFLPTLALQMLVENALKHNYYSRQHPLNIEIRNSGNSTLQVTNNLNPRVGEEVESTGLGLDNIRKRYTVYTRQAVQVYTDNRQYKVQIPLLNWNNESVRHLLPKPKSHDHKSLSH